MPSVSLQKKKTDTISFAIRAERSLYETFRDQTHRDGLNPSVVIRQFIRSYNDGNMSV